MTADQTSESRSAAPLEDVGSDVLAMQLTVLARSGGVNSAEWNAIQTEMARRRLKHLPPAQPIPDSLRSQIITLLANDPGSTPSQLASQLARSTTVVSRVLTNLLKAEVVTFDSDPGDGRIRRYRLSCAQTSVKTAVDTPASAVENERQYISLVIATAVRARRRSNDLDYAADRLGRVLAQAEKLGVDDLALVARREYITTLRQALRFDEVDEQIQSLLDIERGVTAIEPHLGLPTSGTISYELGRQPSRPPRERLDHLTTAATVFRRCNELDEATDWCPREGWALMASADLWREQTEFGVAHACAKRASEIFVANDDVYGEAEATRVQGFCQRLRGEFEDAIVTLERAASRAKETSADRCLADILLQLGDAHRCRGELAAAHSYLTEAAAIAQRIGRRHTAGFCQTGLAAVAFAAGSYDEAWVAAAEAATLLETSTSGSALNTRRRAVIAREISSAGERTKLRAIDLFGTSLRQYQGLRSPAGIAACCVGIGRVLANRERQLVAAVGDLVRVASAGSGRLLLPIDPWVPSLVQQWASETEINDVRRVADWTFSSDRERPAASEMAGEPRCESKLLAA